MLTIGQPSVTLPALMPRQFHGLGREEMVVEAAPNPAVKALGPALYAKIEMIWDGGTMTVDELSIDELEKVGAFLKSWVIKEPGEAEEAGVYLVQIEGALKKKRTERRNRMLMYGGGALGLAALIGGGIWLARR